MASVRIDKGIDAHARPEYIPADKWKQLVSARESYIRHDFTYDCRCLLEWVRDAERLWEPLGYDSADDLIAKGYELEPEEVRLASRWLEINCPDEAIGYEELKNKSQEMAADPEVKKLAKQGEHKGSNQYETKELSFQSKDSVKGGNSADYLVRRLKRDAPEVADALARGEYKSARAAGIAAGIVKVPTKVQEAKKAVGKLTDEEWKEVKAWRDGK